MALQGSGKITLQDIINEFGGSAPYKLTKYYRNGGLVGSDNTGVPTSGTIKLSHFYGASAAPSRVAVTITISANQNNYILNTAKVAGYSAGLTDVTFNINSGRVLSATTTANYGLTVDTSWAAGDTIRINNSGTIVGMGGAGGIGKDGANTMPDGGVGGDAMRILRSTNVNNLGVIAGGGGGGGGGGTMIAGGGVPPVLRSYGGGGGGGGRSGTTNAPGGVGGTTADFPGANGAAGTFATAGTGGTGGNSPRTDGAPGGGWGAVGADAAADEGIIVPGHGGSGGRSVIGNANITWIATGTRYGAIT